MIILGDEIPLIQNIYFSLQRHRFLWLLFLLTATLDYVTTINFMTKGSISDEANMVIQYLAYELGIFHGVFWGKVLQCFSGIGFCALSRYLSRAILLLLILLNMVAVFINTVY